MAQKEIHITGVGLVLFQKRRASRYIKIRIKNNKVLVSLPYYTPYLVAKEVVRSKKDWINKIVAKTTSGQLVPGAQLYDGYTLCFETHSNAKIRTKIIKQQKQLIIAYPNNLTYTSTEVQDAALKLCERYLKNQAESILPLRIEELAERHHFRYSTVKVAKFTAKWGSCDHRQNIKLNYYLLQLPVQLIDYVIIHELCHTKHLNHSQYFWDEVMKCLLNFRELKNELKKYQTTISLS